MKTETDQRFPEVKEARLRVPLSSLGDYEKQGWCADGTSFEEDGERMVDVHRSYVFDGAQLLSFPKEVSALFAETRFSGEDVRSGRLFLTALGYFEAELNGVPLTEDRLIPPKSDYMARDLTKISYPIRDRMSHRIYYYEYDVSPLLKEENLLRVHVGRGWLDNRNPAERMPFWSENLLIFRFVFETVDGEIKELCSSTENTVWRESYIRDTSLYFGETHDYSFLPEQAEAHPCRAIPKPATFFQKADFTGDRPCGEVIPELIFEEGDYRLYDLHTIPAGWAMVEPFAPGTVTVRYGDVLKDGAGQTKTDEPFVLRHTGGERRQQKDEFRFTEKEVGGRFHVHFTWHASRYLLVEGPATVPTFLKIHSPLWQTKTYKNEDPTLQWIFDAFTDTVKANLHGFIPSDCPHRERLGYTGDGQLTSRAVMKVFDAKTMYRKWMRDILDCQGIDNGHVQHTAPFYGGGGGPGGWGGAVCLVPWNYYEIYGDDELLKMSFRGMLAYLDYMEAHTEDGLVTREEKDGWCLGDWCPPHNDVRIPCDFVNTVFYVLCLDIAVKTGALLGKTEKNETLLQRKKRAEDALTRAYFDKETHRFCDGVQGADAFALEAGLGDEETARRLVKTYEEREDFDTGIFGTNFVLKALLRLGRKDLVRKLLTSEGENSFYNMKKGGTNTLWENWDGCDSLCHPMFGAVVESLLEI